MVTLSKIDAPNAAKMVQILDRKTDRIVAVLDNVLKDKIFYADEHVDSGNNYETFDFTSRVTIAEAAHMTGQNRVIIPADIPGTYREFVIFNVFKSSDGSVEVKSNGSYLELEKEKIFAPFKITGQNTGQAMNYGLGGLSWQVGQVEPTTQLADLEATGDMGAYSYLLMVAETFGMKLRFRIETNGNRVTGRFVDLLHNVGVDNGKEVVFGKDLIGVQRHESTDDIVTALRIVGPENEYGGQLRIEVTDEDALQRWGRDGRHIWGTYQIPDEEGNVTEARARTLGAAELKKRITAAIQYEVEAVSLEHVYGLSHERATKGDLVRVKDTSFVPPLYLDARIIEVRRSISDPKAKKFVLGEFIEYTEEDIMKTFKRLQEQFGTKIVRQDAPPAAAFNIVWVKPGAAGKPDVAYVWNPTINNWGRITPTTAAEVGAETPAGAQEKADDAADIVRQDLEEKISQIVVTRPNLLEGTRNWNGWDQSYNDPVLDPSMTYNGAIPIKINASWGYLGRYYTLEDGVTYSLSAWVRTNTAGMVVGFYPFAVDFVSAPLPANEWIRWTATFTVAAGSAILPGSYLIRIESAEPSATASLWIAGMKLEEGEPASDWNQHAGDVPRQIEEQAENVLLVETRLTEAEQRISDESITNTVIASRSFAAQMEQKANSDDLANYAPTESVDQVNDSLNNLSGRFDAINFEDFALSSELVQTEKSLTARFSASGGINLIRNSVGFTGTDFWTASGTGSIRSVTSDELERLGFNSGFEIAAATLKQEVAVLPNRWYSLSFFYKKPLTDSSLKITVTDADTGTMNIKTHTVAAGTTTDGYQKIELTFVPGATRIMIDVTGTGSAVTVSALMLNIGDVPFAWTTASGEVYNTNVKMDLNGLRVQQTEDGFTTHYTEMTPQRFAAFYDSDNDGIIDMTPGSVDEVFRMDRDEFVMKKANVKEEITLGGMKIIRIASDGHDGWAFVGS